MKVTKKLVMSFLMGVMLLCLAFSFINLSTNTNFASNAEQLTNVVSKGGSIYLSDGATFNMKKGTIKGSQADKCGAVYVASGATFTMTAGTIEAN